MESNSTNTSTDDHLLHDLAWIDYLLIPNILSVALAVPLNLLVLGLIVSGSLAKVSEIPAINQVLCELGITVASVMGILYNYTGAEPLDAAYRFFLGLLLAGRLLFTNLVCASCYAAVAHPVAFLRVKSRRVRLAVSAASWLALLAICVVGAFTSEAVMGLMSMVVSIVSTAGQLLCCLLILRRLARPPPGEPGRRRLDGVKLRALAVIGAHLVSTLVTFLPFVVVTGMKELFVYSQYLRWTSITGYFAVVGGFVQPLLWVWRARRLPCRRAP